MLLLMYFNTSHYHNSKNERDGSCASAIKLSHLLQRHQKHFPLLSLFLLCIVVRKGCTYEMVISSPFAMSSQATTFIG